MATISSSLAPRYLSTHETDDRVALVGERAAIELRLRRPRALLHRVKSPD